MITINPLQVLIEEEVAMGQIMCEIVDHEAERGDKPTDADE